MSSRSAWIRSVWLAVVFTSILLTAACGDDDTPTEPTPTTPATSTDVFTGTLERNFSFTHTFVSAIGGVAVTVTSLSPTSTTLIGVSLGTWNGAACDLRITNDRATQGSIVLGQASTGGTLCVRVSDSQGLSEPTSYEVTVVRNTP